MSAATLLMPPGINAIAPAVSRPFYVAQMIAFLVALSLLVLRRGKVGVVCWLVISCYTFSVIVGLCFQSGDSLTREPFIIIALSILACISYRESKSAFLSAFSLYFELIVILQVILQILYPFGMYVEEGYWQNWILGFKNIPVRILLPGACIVFLSTYNRFGKLFTVRSLVYLALTAFVVVSSRSGTGIIGLACFVLMLVIFCRNGLPKVLNVGVIAVGSIVVFLLIYFLDFQYNFEYLLSNILGKSLDFTGRINVWGVALGLLQDVPLTGQGLYSTYVGVLGAYHHAHQYWLQILIQGGFFSFMLILCSYLYVGYRSTQAEKSTELFLITITVAAFMVMGIDESLMGGHMLLPLLVIANEALNDQGVPSLLGGSRKKSAQIPVTSGGTVKKRRFTNAK